MEDIRNYDDAVVKFHKTLNLNSLPLSSWDFYSQFFDKTCNIAEDIKSLSQFAQNNAWAFDTQIFEEELKNKEHVIVVTDTSLKIVYATQNIWEMNRYIPSQIIGNKPKMFQGEKTCKNSLKLISKAVKEKKPFETTILNYRKDGSTYKCWIKGQPVYNLAGDVINFIAFEKEVA
ncbi:MAG: PAS domain-containing protein [Maribacter sp.]